MKIYQLFALIIMAVFYLAYFTKMYLQKRRGIQTHQINKGVKPQETKQVERIMGFATLAIVVVELVSIFFDVRMFAAIPLTVAGLLVAAIGDMTFIVAMITMKDSWRAGISESEKTQLITDGIYRFSRNPAFLGFDLMYIGIMLAFLNIPLLCFTVLVVISLHLQILQEEKFLITVFGDSYKEYQKRTCRYLGVMRH